MGVSIVLNIDNKTRFDIGVASKICGEDYIIIFKRYSDNHWVFK